VLPLKREVPDALEMTSSRKASPVKVVGRESVGEFSFNTDKSEYGRYSGSHQSCTATGIGNGGEILGYTIPLDASLKRVKEGRRYQPAILTFHQAGKEVQLLAVANDTGGRHVGGSSRNRGWGELGINTWFAARDAGLDVSIGRNRVSVPGTRLEYEFLPGEVRTVSQYRELQERLRASGQLPGARSTRALTVTPMKSLAESQSRGDTSAGTVVYCDLSERRCWVMRDGKKVFDYKGIEYSRVGIGSKPGSNRTPVGEFAVRKEPHHNYGPALRVLGPCENGVSQSRRGILIHRDNTRDGGSRGCIHVGSRSTMQRLFDAVEGDARVVIRR